jgi:hypothetical protein
MINQTVHVEYGDGQTLATTLFQLMQWRSALKLEVIGMTMSGGRKVSTHLRRAMGLKRTYPIKNLQQWVQATIEAVEGELA